MIVVIVMLSECFWTFFAALLSGLMYKAFRMVYKSKCTDIQCCGLIVKRDVTAETRINNNSDSTNSSLSSLDATQIVNV